MEVISGRRGKRQLVGNSSAVGYHWVANKLVEKVTVEWNYLQMKKRYDATLIKLHGQYLEPSGYLEIFWETGVQDGQAQVLVKNERKLQLGVLMWDIQGRTWLWLIVLGGD